MKQYLVKVASLALLGICGFAHATLDPKLTVTLATPNPLSPFAPSVTGPAHAGYSDSSTGRTLTSYGGATFQAWATCAFASNVNSSVSAGNPTLQNWNVVYTGTPPPGTTIMDVAFLAPTCMSSSAVDISNVGFNYLSIAVSVSWLIYSDTLTCAPPYGVNIGITRGPVNTNAIPRVARLAFNSGHNDWEGVLQLPINFNGCSCTVSSGPPLGGHADASYKEIWDLGGSVQYQYY